MAEPRTMSDAELIERIVDAAVKATETRADLRLQSGAEARADLQRVFSTERSELDRLKAEAWSRLAAARPAGVTISEFDLRLWCDETAAALAGTFQRAARDLLDSIAAEPEPGGPEEPDHE